MIRQNEDNKALVLELHQARAKIHEQQVQIQLISEREKSMAEESKNAFKMLTEEYKKVEMKLNATYSEVFNSRICLY